MRQIPVCRTCLSVLDALAPWPNGPIGSTHEPTDVCASCGEPAEYLIAPGAPTDQVVGIDIDLTGEVTRIALDGWLGAHGVATVVEELMALRLVEQAFILDLTALDGIDPAGLAALDEAIGTLLDAGAHLGVIPQAVGGPVLGGVIGGSFEIERVADATESFLVVDADLDVVAARLRQAAFTGRAVAGHDGP